jgi:RecB family exonuclease
VKTNVTPSEAPRLTASRLDLAKKCPGSFALPHVYTKSEAASRGTAIHEYIAASLLALKTPAQVGVPKIAWELCESLDIEELHAYAQPILDDTLYVELALAWKPEDDTGFFTFSKEQRGHRDYSAAPAGSLVGTADAVCVEDVQVLITDWKTGRWEVPDPAENLQLLFLALAAARAFSKPEAVVQIVQIGEDGALTHRFAELDSEDLESVSETLRDILARVEQSRRAEFPDLFPGSHCRFCPAFHACPAQYGAAQSLMEESLEELTPRRAADVWRRLQAVEAATKRVRQVLADYTATRPVSLPGGKELRLIESRRDYIDAGIAMPILREVMGDAADEAVTVSKTSLKNAVRKDMLPGVLTKIEEAGGIEARYSESLREVRK